VCKVMIPCSRRKYVLGTCISAWRLLVLCLKRYTCRLHSVVRTGCINAPHASAVTEASLPFAWLTSVVNLQHGGRAEHEQATLHTMQCSSKRSTTTVEINAAGLPCLSSCDYRVGLVPWYIIQQQ
jgi:hypothetical protein